VCESVQDLALPIVCKCTPIGHADINPHQVHTNSISSSSGLLTSQHIHLKKAHAWGDFHIWMMYSISGWNKCNGLHTPTWWAPTTCKGHMICWCCTYQMLQHLLKSHHPCYWFWPCVLGLCVKGHGPLQDAASVLCNCSKKWAGKKVLKKRLCTELDDAGFVNRAVDVVGSNWYIQVAASALGSSGVKHERDLPLNTPVT